MFRIPSIDFRLQGNATSAERIKERLIEIGFTFDGELDDEDRQDVSLPKGWTTEGDTDPNSTSWYILDENMVRRLNVRRKIPWGDNDFISFVIVEPDLNSDNSNLMEFWN